MCAEKSIPVIPIPGPSAVVSALSASGLPTNEFTFGNLRINYYLLQLMNYLESGLHYAAVGFLPKHATTRRERLMVSANNATTQVFFVPPHKLCQFLEEASSIFGNSR